MSEEEWETTGESEHESDSDVQEHHQIDTKSTHSTARYVREKLQVEGNAIE